ncbi:hypothetical protein T4B_15272 [Trichinella pseudospiralis]|uniref:Uncharacterized protein n=1 Tax=Trichinella pseudospiralis TaxID=6337 RepID=A0A0V1J556_TRIPS|nr:hypothetical protein T4B_15272 [Trichinella pseudospiralis]
MDSCGRCPADVSPINSLLLHLSCFSIEYKLRTTPESSTTCYKYRSRAPAAFHTPKAATRRLEQCCMIRSRPEDKEMLTQKPTNHTVGRVRQARRLDFLPLAGRRTV